MNSFLIAHQNIAVPVIEWGGLFLLLFIILSPFLIIRHHYFRPTRWWHIVGAYVGSIALFLIHFPLLDLLNPLLTRHVLTTWDLYGAYQQAGLRFFLNILWIYPALTFYSTLLLFQHFNLKNFFTTLGVAILMVVVIGILTIYATAYFIGQAFMEHF